MTLGSGKRSRLSPGLPLSVARHALATTDSLASKKGRRAERKLVAARASIEACVTLASAHSGDSPVAALSVSGSQTPSAPSEPGTTPLSPLATPTCEPPIAIIGRGSWWSSPWSWEVEVVQLVVLVAKIRGAVAPWPRTNNELVDLGETLNSTRRARRGRERQESSAAAELEAATLRAPRRRVR